MCFIQLIWLEISNPTKMVEVRGQGHCNMCWQLHNLVLLGVNWRVLLDRFCGIFIMMGPNKTMDEKVGNNNMTTYSRISFWIRLVVSNVNDYASAQMTFSYINKISEKTMWWNAIYSVVSFFTNRGAHQEILSSNGNFQNLQVVTSLLVLQRGDK